MGRYGLRRQPADFRLTLTKPFAQDETDRPEIWFVRADGSNLHDIVDAARDHILDAGFAWFATLDGVDRMLNAARYEPLTRYTATGMGNLGSPDRIDLIAALEGARR